MKIFGSLTDAIAWWKESCQAPVCLLVDFTDVGSGIQRREARLERGTWILNIVGRQS